MFIYYFRTDSAHHHTWFVCLISLVVCFENYCSVSIVLYCFDYFQLLSNGPLMVCCMENPGVWDCWLMEGFCWCSNRLIAGAWLPSCSWNEVFRCYGWCSNCSLVNFSWCLVVRLLCQTLRGLNGCLACRCRMAVLSIFSFKSEHRFW